MQMSASFHRSCGHRPYDPSRSPPRKREYSMPSNLLTVEGGSSGKQRGPRPASRRRLSPALLPLEDRALLSGGPEPTNYEQYMLALINRARANPAVEGQRLLSIAQ